MTQLDDTDLISVRIQHDRETRTLNFNAKQDCATVQTNGYKAVGSTKRAELPAVFSIAVIQSSFRRLRRTTNVVERRHREVRRSSVVSIFPNPAACLRLVSAILAEMR